jgi:uncharacterized protein (TIGR00369 family)
LQAALDQAAFVRYLGLRLRSFGDGECELDVPFREEFLRPGGVVAGHIYVAAADVAMWLAIKTRLGAADASVTAEMKTNFLSSVRSEDFVCNAKVLKVGRRLIYGVAQCETEKGALVAHHTVTYIRPG